MEESLQYANERSTFGQPIYDQGVSFMIADMATKVEAARLLTWQAAKKADSGERNTLEAAHAKRFAADIAMEVTTDAVQVFGGYGYSEEYPVARRMRGCKGSTDFRGFESDSETHHQQRDAEGLDSAHRAESCDRLLEISPSIPGDGYHASITGCAKPIDGNCDTGNDDCTISSSCSGCLSSCTSPHLFGADWRLVGRYQHGS